MIKTLCFIFSFIIALASPELEDKKINFLLNEVEKSGLKFFRNGEEHSAKEAKSHLKFKYNKARGFFFSSDDITAQKFIDKIASSSSTTGEKYFIILKSGKKVPTKQWLDEKLKSFPPPKTP
jgi:hypothetical protein